MTLLRRWWPELVLLAGFVGLTAVLWTDHWLGVDVTVTHWCDTHRPPVADWLARNGNYLGQGGYLTLLCLGIALVLAWRRRSASAPRWARSAPACGPIWSSSPKTFRWYG